MSLPPSREVRPTAPRSRPSAHSRTAGATSATKPAPWDGGRLSDAVEVDAIPSRVCFLTAAVAFSAAAAGAVVHHWLVGWMETAGMAAVGLFYLGLGLLEWGRRSG